jgi:hypothetical protein
MTEFKSDGTPIFHTYMDSGFLGLGVENYRGFRYNWTGIPNEAPAVVALKDEETSTTNIYVSWNGDTCTKIWRFYEVGDNGRRSFLGVSKRVSFETLLQLDQADFKTVQAQAVDVECTVLTDTSTVKLELMVQQIKWEGTSIAKQDKSGPIPWFVYLWSAKVLRI